MQGAEPSGSCHVATALVEPSGEVINVEPSGEVTREGFHAAATTDTYFGRFPASYWQRWTATTEVEFTVSLTGTGRVSVRASDATGASRTLAVVMATCTGA